MNTLRNDTDNRTDPTTQPTIFHLKQSTLTRHSDRNHFPIGILDSGIHVPRSGWNIYNRTGMNPQRPIGNTITYSNISNNCNISDTVSSASSLSYRGLTWHRKMKIEGIKPMENHKGIKKFKNDERENNFEVEKVGHESSQD